MVHLSREKNDNWMLIFVFTFLFMSPITGLAAKSESCQNIFTLQRSFALRESGVTFLTHTTGLRTALKVLIDRSLKSHSTQTKENPKLQSVNDGDERFVYMSWTDSLESSFTKVNRYTPKNGGGLALLLLPTSYIDSKSFRYYSNSWKYGMDPEYSAQDFVEGLRPSGRVNDSVEVLFRNRLDFAVEDARLIVSPKVRDEVLQQLSLLDSSVDWEKIVLKREDPFQDPLSITFDRLVEMSSPYALLDIYEGDPVRALDFSKRYVELAEQRSIPLNSGTLAVLNAADWIYMANDFAGFSAKALKSFETSHSLENAWLFRRFKHKSLEILQVGASSPTFPLSVAKRNETANKLRAWLSHQPEAVRKHFQNEI